MLSKYNFILWDFDGVIIDSNPARVLGFERVLKNYPRDQVSELIHYHQKNGGLSRYVKFKYFFEKIRNEQVGENQILKMANEFSVLMKEILTDRNLLISDSVEFIKQNVDRLSMHIVSGSDGKELNYLCKELGISDYFKTISGSPTSKIDLVKHLVNSNAIISNETCLIGDSGNDFDAAFQNGIDFYAYNNSDLKCTGNGYIEKLMV